MRQAIVRVALLAFALACASGETGEERVAVRDSAGVRIVTLSGSRAELPVWPVAAPGDVVLDGSREPFFQRVTDAAWFPDGRIIVLDRQADQLYLFESNGTYVRAFGRPGDGPGEFANIAAVTVTAQDSILVFDRAHNRFTVFHPDAGFVRDVALPQDSAGIFNTDVNVVTPDRFVLWGGREDLSWMENYDGRAFANPATTRVSVIDASGARIAGPLVLAGPTVSQFEWGSGRIPFSPQPAVAGGSGRIATGEAATWTVRVWSPELELRMEVRWSGSLEPVTPEDLEKVREQTRATFERVNTTFMQEALDLYDAPGVIPANRPAHGRILLGRGGAIWVSRYEQFVYPTDWTVLTPDGTPAGRVQLPDGAYLLAADRGTLLFALPDSLDVQSVHVTSVPELRAALEAGGPPRTR